MLKAIRRITKRWRRRRQLVQIRREFEICGYPLEHLDDAGIEAALTGGKCRIEEIPLSAKAIYFALRRLSNGGIKHFGTRKIQSARIISKKRY